MKSGRRIGWMVAGAQWNMQCNNDGIKIKMRSENKKQENPINSCSQRVSIEIIIFALGNELVSFVVAGRRQRQLQRCHALAPWGYTTISISSLAHSNSVALFSISLICSSLFFIFYFIVFCHFLFCFCFGFEFAFMLWCMCTHSLFGE